MSFSIVIIVADLHRQIKWKIISNLVSHYITVIYVKHISRRPKAYCALKQSSIYGDDTAIAGAVADAVPSTVARCHRIVENRHHNTINIYTYYCQASLLQPTAGTVSHR